MESSNSKSETKPSKLHHRYIMVILVGVIVLLLSINWSSVTGLPEMINMALALSSLILAGLAIVYSFLTSGSLNKTLDKIEESSQTIKKTSASMEQSNLELRDKVEAIPGAIASVKETVDNTHKFLETIPENIATQKEDQTKISGSLPEELILQYIRTASVGTLDGITILLMAYEKGVSVNYNGLLQEEIESGFMEGAMFGAFDTVYAFNLAEIKIKTREETESKREYYLEIKSINSVLVDNLYKHYEEKLDSVSKIIGSKQIGGISADITKRKNILSQLVDKYSIEE